MYCDETGVAPASTFCSTSSAASQPAPRKSTSSNETNYWMWALPYIGYEPHQEWCSLLLFIRSFIWTR